MNILDIWRISLMRLNRTDRIQAARPNKVQRYDIKGQMSTTFSVTWQIIVSGA